jgi:hypothetical protein
VPQGGGRRALGVPLDGFSFNALIPLYVRKGIQYEAM